MPKGLKQTSSQIIVSFSTTESAPNTFTSDRVDLQLNALDNEVFVVTAMKMDLDDPQYNLAQPLAAGVTAPRFVKATVSKQDITNASDRTLGNPSVIASASKFLEFVSRTPLGTTTDQIAASFFSQENSTDTPSDLEYIDIIATPDFYVNIEGLDNQGARSVHGKLYGYRARADASTYAALVQSELLSQ